MADSSYNSHNPSIMEIFQMMGSGYKPEPARATQALSQLSRLVHVALKNQRLLCIHHGQ